MAAFKLTANVPQTQPNVGGSNTAAATILAFKAPANQRVKLLSYGFFFDGTLNSAQPVQIILGRITTFTGSYTSVTLAPDEPELTESPQTIAYLNNAGATEPTYTAIKTWTVHPQLGYEKIEALDDEIIIPGGTYVGFQVKEPASVNVRGYAKIEE